jgi:glycerophosphoryl diester phosphodiesterase
MNFIQHILILGYKFNSFTTTGTYQTGYYICAILFFLSSYISQYLCEKPCYELAAIVIRTIHHFSLFFIYFGFLAPTDIIPYMLALTLITLSYWIILKNKCVLTMTENYFCNHSRNREFRDITYYLSKRFDRFMFSVRIPILIVMIVFIIIRTYVYYRSNRVEIQGHRGARGNRPENTMAAFDFALSNGITTLELDLHMSSDGELVIYHNDTINRVICNSAIYHGSGGDGGSSSDYIKTLTLNELKTYDCGTLKNPEFPEQVQSKEHIPTFIELVTYVKQKYPLLNVRFNVEIKRSDTDSDNYIKEFTKKVVDIFEKNGLIRGSIIQSFDVNALQYVKVLNPYIQTSLLVDNLKEQNTEKVIGVCVENGFDIVSPNFEDLSKGIIDKFKDGDRKIEVIPWTVNKIDDLKEMMQMGVCSIITDYPVIMKEYLATS